ncbi:MAG: hypothetical protein WAV21_00875 [Minisyncoccia bacterium]
MHIILSTQPRHVRKLRQAIQEALRGACKELGACDEVAVFIKNLSADSGEKSLLQMYGRPTLASTEENFNPTEHRKKQDRWMRSFLILIRTQTEGHDILVWDAFSQREYTLKEVVSHADDHL